VPELPEVETLVRGVREELVGKCFVSVSFLRADIREPIPAARLKTILISEPVQSVTRRGKYMLIQTRQGFMGVHLGMSGKFILSSKVEPLLSHTHAVFELSDGRQFRFIDPRRFGRLFSVEPNELLQHPFLAKLGVEPLDVNINLPKHLFLASRRRAQGVKVFLMDSRVVVGVGNIYASESLWRAKMNPHTSAKLLTTKMYSKLAQQITEVLSEAITAGGTTLRDYRNKDGKPGYFQTNLAVYGRDAKPCVVCNAKIVKTIQAARSTYHCPICQK
jgi:formamidopyrimidine-DNA glycosylase